MCPETGMKDSLDFLCRKVMHARGEVYTTMFVKKSGNYFVTAYIYVDDIVFSSNSKTKVAEFVDQIKSEFQMSIMGMLNYFLSLQVKQTKDEIFISQRKYGTQSGKEIQFRYVNL